MESAAQPAREHSRTSATAAGMGPAITGMRHKDDKTGRKPLPLNLVTGSKMCF